ncbi:MAG: DUF5658 family protein [Chloroflexi bacterium]|nr:DUF5658 family protein [Chloroflexota bacterium]
MPGVLTAKTSAVLLSFASVAVALQTMDLLTGIRLMLVFGIDQEQNPITRSIFASGGPLGLMLAKLAVVLSGVLVLLLVARAGRPRLARNSLAVVALLGLLGFVSNLV